MFRTIAIPVTIVAALLANSAAAQAGFLDRIVSDLIESDAIISDPSDNPEVQAEIDYLDRAEQAEIDYLGRDAQAEIDYYNSFNR